MLALIAPILSMLSGIFPAVKDYLSYKEKIKNTEREIEVTQLNNQLSALQSNNEADTAQRQNYLNSVTQKFRQGTFIFFMIPFLISMFFPQYAKLMWENFNAIPPDFRNLFFLIYGVIWGLPIAKENLSQLMQSINRGISARRDYKMNMAKVFNSLREEPEFKEKGISQRTVDMVEKAIEAGQELP